MHEKLDMSNKTDNNQEPEQERENSWIGVDPLVRPDYEIEGLAIFRQIEPKFIQMPNDKVAQLYRIWSDQQACASWIGVTNRGAEYFCKWAFTTPADFILES